MIINARIDKVRFGFGHEYDDKDASLVFYVCLTTERGVTALGGDVQERAAFDDEGRYLPGDFNVNPVCKIVRGLLEITDTEELWKTSGAYIRCELSDKEPHEFLRIGHILQDKWIDLPSWSK